MVARMLQRSVIAPLCASQKYSRTPAQIWGSVFSAFTRHGFGSDNQTAGRWQLGRVTGPEHNIGSTTGAPRVCPAQSPTPRIGCKRHRHPFDLFHTTYDRGAFDLGATLRLTCKGRPGTAPRRHHAAQEVSAGKAHGRTGVAFDGHGAVSDGVDIFSLVVEIPACHGVAHPV